MSIISVTNLKVGDVIQYVVPSMLKDNKKKNHLCVVLQNKGNKLFLLPLSTAHCWKTSWEGKKTNYLLGQEGFVLPYYNGKVSQVCPNVMGWKMVGDSVPHQVKFLFHLDSMSWDSVITSLKGCVNGKVHPAFKDYGLKLQSHWKMMLNSASIPLAYPG